MNPILESKRNRSRRAVVSGRRETAAGHRTSVATVRRSIAARRAGTGNNPQAASAARVENRQEQRSRLFQGDAISDRLFVDSKARVIGLRLGVATVGEYRVFVECVRRIVVDLSLGLSIAASI
jgi:hypothetical protein